MKRLGSTDSLGALISICPSTDDQKTSGNSSSVYSRGFQSMLEGLEEEDCLLEEEQGGGGGGGGQKKRRLSVDQVKALEKNFEVENKLEPDRKVKLAHELGLQPRQVAVWFQNRRARWKTKQLERDYGFLKSNFDSLKQDFQTLQQDKEALLTELRELKSKIHGEETESTNHSTEEEKSLLKSEPEKISLMNETTCYNNNSNGGIGGISVFGDGSSDSGDSSAILNEEININNSPISSSGADAHVLQQQLLNMSPPSIPLLPHASSFNCSSSSSPSSINCFQFSDSRGISTNTQSDYHHQQQSQPFVRMEEHNFFGAEEVTCNFFSDEQAPTLQWYNQDPWN